MTDRDEFAKAAMQGMLGEGYHYTDSTLATDAYALADAVLKARGDQQECSRCRELEIALEDLIAEQNGPPLLKHAKSWEAAMKNASGLLARAPRAAPERGAR